MDQNLPPGTSGAGKRPATPDAPTSSSLPTAGEGQLPSVNDAGLNETLEVFATTYNLSAQNVKNIIFHVLKNPQTFSTLIGKDKEAVDMLRLTRARKRELEKITQTKLGIELRPISHPKTFLDVDYGDEEEDVDYRPDEETSAVEDDERTAPEEEDGNDNEDEFPAESNPQWGDLMREGVGVENDVTPTPHHSLLVGEDVESSSSNMLVTQVDDADYLQFVNSCLSSDPLLASFNDDDDDEYNVFQDIETDAVEEEEYRMDRTTRVPRWEIEALYDDVLTPDGEPVVMRKKCHSHPHAHHRNQERLHAFKHPASTGNARSETPIKQQPGTSSAGGSGGFVPAGSTGLGSNADAADTSVDFSATSCSLGRLGDDEEEEEEDMGSQRSCSLLAGEIVLSGDELQLLRVQLEKHVQLLTQCVVGSFGEAELATSYNSAVKMIHDLNDEQERSERDGAKSILFTHTHLSILQDAIVSCHDISACQSVELPCLSVDSNFTSPSYYAYSPPRSEVVWVLSRSRALRYPELLPNFRFIRHETPSSKFLPSEQILLAMALHQLRRVRHSNWKQTQGKYPLIAQHYLPNKSVAQIKNHMKNVRSSQKQSPLHTILLNAERGVFNATFQLGVGAARNEIPLEWEERCQPQWLQQISKLYREGLIRVVNAAGTASPDNPRPEASSYSQVIPDRGAVRVGAAGHAPSTPREAHRSRHSSLAEEEESNSNDRRSNVEGLEMSGDAGGVEGKRHKSRKRLRMERGAQALVDARIRERALRALVEAVNADLKQRLFMHQDKLREIQALIADRELSTAEKFRRLADKYSDEYFSVVALLSALLTPTPDIALSADPATNAHRKALEMFLDVQCYLSGACRNVAAIRNAFKSIKEDIEKEGAVTERWLAEKLKQQFGTRDEPLWRLLKTRLDSQKWDEKPQDWEYEFIDMDRDYHQAVQEGNTSMGGGLEETLTLPYRYDSSERGRLRLRHGRVTLEQNGRLKAVNIGLVTEANEGVTPHKSDPGVPVWSREDDKLLLMSLNHYRGDKRMVVANFKIPGKNSLDRAAIEERLAYLLNLVQLAHHSSA